MSYHTRDQVTKTVEKLAGETLDGFARFPIKANIAYFQRNNGYFFQLSEEERKGLVRRKRKLGQLLL